MTWYAEGIQRTDDGYFIQPNAVVPSLHSQRNCVLHVGRNAVIQGNINHEGSVTLGAGAQIWGLLRGGHEVILAPGAQAKNVEAFGRVTVQHGATCGDIQAGGDVLLLGNCTVGKVSAGGDIVIVGAPSTQGLQPGGRIQTRPF
ncbi:MAG: hypothetical protein ACPHK8_03660 [Thermoplasmatota archaeon]